MQTETVLILLFSVAATVSSCRLGRFMLWAATLRCSRFSRNGDVTFRPYDWDHVDAKTGQRRALQVDQAIACIDSAQGAMSPAVPMVEEVKPLL